jgi:hypothetical protein
MAAAAGSGGGGASTELESLFDRLQQQMGQGSDAKVLKTADQSE